ncbi:hypothetical protein [uncultured Nocardioides sp.]|uniref:hypothetical protein n=1 Tax=uncultured Nocardioides sp. TaxID=198441 RepID=UPI00261EC633|nr:hypothetical protein [uncultured Nocardioides sp.]
MRTDYRLSPRVVARVVGGLLLVLGVVVLVLTVVVAALDLPTWTLLVVALGALLTVSGTAWFVARTGWVLRVTDEGYVVRFVRGVGTDRARWKDVEDAVTATVGGTPCVVVRLRDGRSSTIPVTLLTVDREQFVRELQEHLRRGQGLRPL